MLVSNLFKTPFHIIFPLKGYALCFGCMVLLFKWVLFGMFWEVVLSFGCCWGISFMGHVKKKKPPLVLLPVKLTSTLSKVTLSTRHPKKGFTWEAVSSKVYIALHPFFLSIFLLFFLTFFEDFYQRSSGP